LAYQLHKLVEEKTKELEQKDNSLEFSCTEITRLKAEVTELKGVHDKIKQKDEEILTMTNQLKKFEEEKQTWTENTEILKDQIDSSLNMGFQLALDQVRVLILDADSSLPFYNFSYVFFYCINPFTCR